MDTEFPKPQLATILSDGQYGQREMTDAEYADYLTIVRDETVASQTSDTSEQENK
jgi:hypothetical protein